MGKFRRVDQYDPVLIEQGRIAGEKQLQIALVGKADPGSPVAQRIGVHGGGHIQRRPHAGAGFPVPGHIAAIDIDPRLFPQPPFLFVGAAVIATGNEGGLGFCDPLQRLGGAGRPGNARRIACRADQDEIVIHEVVAFHPETVADEFFLRGFVMDQQHIGIALAGQADGRAGADGDDMNIDPRFPGEERQQIIE